MSLDSCGLDSFTYSKKDVSQERRHLNKKRIDNKQEVAALFTIDNKNVSVVDSGTIINRLIII